jgi:hypothetical protein
MANRTNNGAQKTTHKTEERATRTAGEGTQVLRKGKQFLPHKWHTNTGKLYLLTMPIDRDTALSQLDQLLPVGSRA